MNRYVTLFERRCLATVQDRTQVGKKKRERETLSTWARGEEKEKDKGPCRRGQGDVDERMSKLAMWDWKKDKNDSMGVQNTSQKRGYIDSWNAVQPSFQSCGHFRAGHDPDADVGPGFPP
jgi:hypothetical protein